MPSWFKAKTAMIDAIVMGGVWLVATWWFWIKLNAAELVGIYAALFAGVQLLRFVNAQLGELEWVKMNEAVLVEKKAAPVRGDGYREAAVVEEAPSAEDEELARAVPRRRRRAQVSLGVVALVMWLLTFVPAILWGAWVVPGVLTFIGALWAAMLLGIRATRTSEARRRDFFMDNLSQDTTAMLDPKRARIAEESEHLRVGVDFGVPADDANTDAPEAENAEAASAREARTR